jgi:transcriptional regulator GlxA family with amidase domain
LRLSRCCSDELANYDNPAESIPETQSGVFDQSHLTNSFRRHCGTSPLRYRSALRDDVTPR